MDEDSVKIPLAQENVVIGHIGEEAKNDESDVGSEGATGSLSALNDDQNEENNDVVDGGDGLSVASDAWDTDLEIEEEKKKYDPTGQDTYVQACKALGIIPASHFLRCLQSEDSTVDMTHHYLGPKGAKALAISLTSNTTVTHLVLGNNGLMVDGGVVIADMLKENCYITHLDLSENQIGPPGAYAIAETLNFNSTLTHLYLRGNNFDDKAVEPISEAIKSSRRVTFLDLSHNQFSEASGVLLGVALAESEVLQTLDLSWNHLRLMGAIAIALALKANQMLKVLNLSYNGFGNEGAMALADALKVNSTLTELDITDNRILTEGAKAFAKVLPNCETLSTLKIGRNPLQLMGVVVLLDSLKQGTSSIKHLGLDGITVTLQVDKIIKAMMSDIPGLEVVHAGTGGYKEAKPLPGPLEKLTNYAKENNVKLQNLFGLFDKEKSGELTEEDFRASLKHISAPLMGFEILKLLKEFGKRKERTIGEGEAPPTKKNEEEDPLIVVDYSQIIEASKSPQSWDKETS